ncbi:MAG: hypothetical protein WCG20_02060 [bacterium]
MKTAAVLAAASKQQLGRESLVTWDEFKQQLAEKTKYLLKLGNKEGNSRMKFLGKVLFQLTKGKLNGTVKDIADPERAYKTEEKMEHIKDSEKQLLAINELWKFINTYKNKIEASNDPFLTLRFTSICEVIGLYQTGDLCFKHKEQFDTTNKANVVLRDSYFYQKQPVVKKKKQELQPVPHEALTV